mgnify:CR=1 FL=1
MNLIKSFLFNLHFFVFTTLLIIIMLPCLFLPFYFVQRVAKIWCFVLKTGMKIWLGIDMKVHGNSYQDRNVIYAVKHQSAWETIICTGLFDMPTIIIKRELVFLPIIGLYFLKGGSIPINRSDNFDSLKKMARMAKKAIKKGRSILIFPQGTRVPVNSDTRDYPYLPGVFFLYSQCKIPVVPVVHNAGLLWPKNSFIKFPSNLKSKTVTMKLLDEIPVGLNKNDFLKELETKTETETKRLIKEET